MSKKLLVGLAVMVVLLGVITFTFGGIYTSSPGFVTKEAADEFYRHAPRCIGIDIRLNTGGVVVDAPGKNFCIGWITHRTIILD